jgi:hypothetical protein
MDLATLRENLHYQGLSLGTVALITSALLALAAAATGPAIQAAEARDLMASLAQVLPGGFDNDLLGDTVTVPGPAGDVTVYRARHGDRLEGVVFKVKRPGLRRAHRRPARAGPSGADPRGEGPQARRDPWPWGQDRAGQGGLDPPLRRQGSRGPAPGALGG